MSDGKQASDQKTPDSQVESAPEEPPDSGSPPDLPVAAYNAGVVGWLYRAISLVGFMVAIGGVGAEVYLNGETQQGLVPPEQLWSAITMGDPSAWTTLGIWILLAGPGLALVSMLISGVRRRSWPAVGLAAVVLTIIAMAVPVMAWIEGSL